MVERQPLRAAQTARTLEISTKELLRLVYMRKSAMS